MNTNLFPSAALVAILSLLAVNFASAPAGAFTMTLDELGNCSSDVGTCSSVFAPDPTGKVTGNVWIFTLPSLVYTTDINIYEPDGKTLSDHLRTIDPDPDNSNLACTLASGKAACADRLIYYSLDDLGGQTPTFTTKVGINENADGSWLFASGAPNYNYYYGVSDVPLPAALPLFASGLVGLGLLGWRRKKAA
jgi:hypothetical protein